MVPRVAAAVMSVAAAAAMPSTTCARGFASRARRYPIVHYRKGLLERKSAWCASAAARGPAPCASRANRHTVPPPPHAVERPLQRHRTLNDPALVPRFLRQAEKTARRLGVLEELAQFDEAAAAAAKPPAIIAAT